MRSDDPRERDVAHGLIISVFRDGRSPGPRRCIAKARKKKWGDTALLAILRALPQQRWTWDRVAGLASAIEQAYWKRAPILWIEEDRRPLPSPCKADRGRSAGTQLCTSRGATSNVDCHGALMAMLTEAVKQPFEEKSDGNEVTMFQHHVIEILNRAGKDGGGHGHAGSIGMGLSAGPGPFPPASESAVNA